MREPLTCYACSAPAKVTRRRVTAATAWSVPVIAINGGLETFQRRNGARGPHGGMSYRVAAVGGAAC